MDNLEVPQEDFVTDHRGVKRHRLPPLRHWDGRFCKHDTRLAETHDILGKARLLTSERGVTNELALATACNADIDGAVWKSDLETLVSRGYLVVVRTEWSLDSCWVKLPENERRVTVTANGMYFANQTLAQLMAER